jgi:hypothetical protein
VALSFPLSQSSEKKLPTLLGVSEAAAGLSDLGINLKHQIERGCCASLLSWFELVEIAEIEKPR